jgi:hypothetical protein
MGATRRRRGRRNPRSRSRRRSPSRRGHAIEHELRVGPVVLGSGSRGSVVRPTRETSAHDLGRALRHPHAVGAPARGSMAAGGPGAYSR